MYAGKPDRVGEVLGMIWEMCGRIQDGVDPSIQKVFVCSSNVYCLEAWRKVESTHAQQQMLCGLLCRHLVPVCRLCLRLHI